jgi:hypothetical protein
MKKRKPTPAAIATEIRRILKGEGSTKHARGVRSAEAGNPMPEIYSERKRIRLPS